MSITAKLRKCKICQIYIVLLCVNLMSRTIRNVQLPIVENSYQSQALGRLVVEDTMGFNSSSNVSIVGYESSQMRIGYHTLRYKFPAERFRHLVKQKVPIVAGVVSSTSNRLKRDAIRNTWANRRSLSYMIGSIAFSPCSVSYALESHFELLLFGLD